MHHYVYCIENLVNGKVYVGKHSTEDLDDGYMGSGKLVKHAIAKHGLENFRRHVLEKFETSEEAFEFEKLLVNEEFVSDENTYNLTCGGTGSWHAANEHFRNNPLLKKQIMKFAKDVAWGNLEYRKKMHVLTSERIKRLHSEGWFSYEHLNFSGKRHKEETKRKIGETNAIKQSGEANSQFGTCWIHNLAELRNTKINKNDLEAYLKLGWVKGRKMKW